MMSEENERFQEEFDAVVTDCQRFCFASRAKEYQLEAIQRLEDLQRKASALKEKAIASQDNDSANCMLAFEEMLNALINELKMWVALKEDNPNAAWDFLVDAQSAARSAIQADEVASHLTNYIERLDRLEHLLFPPQIFISIGGVARQSECSICGREYGECDHVVGRAYMGKLCFRIMKDLEIHNAAIVDEPGSKHCRTLSFSDGKLWRDIMTWRPISQCEPHKEA